MQSGKIIQQKQKRKTEQLFNQQSQSIIQEGNKQSETGRLLQQQLISPPLIKVQIKKEQLQERKKKRIWFKGFTIVIILITIVSMVLNKKK